MINNQSEKVDTIHNVPPPQQDNFSAITTLSELKQYLKANYEKGVDCPCCKQLVKLYKRSFNTGMAYSLILLYKMHRQSPGEWIHIQNRFASDYKLNANKMDYSQLERWELMEKKPASNEEESAGLFRITEKGIDFVRGKIKIKQRVHVYNGKCYGFSGNEITINEGLNNKFDYEDLMRNYLED